MEKKKGLIIGGVVVAVLLIATLLVLYIQEKKTSGEIIQLLELEKLEMENEYNTFATQYEELQITITNDSLSELLDREKIRVQRLQEELRSVKATNAAEITRLKKELTTVRAVLRSYIIQIDSLNRVNEALIAENKNVRQQYNAATRQINTLSTERATLAQKVELASQLDVTNIRVEPRNKRDKQAKKVKDIMKFVINFTIVKNTTAPAGEKTIYLQIAKPDNDILTKSPSNTFQYENRQLPFSIKKYIEYDGEEQNVTVYWDVEEFLHAGNYRVSIFADGNMIGRRDFTLE